MPDRSYGALIRVYTPNAPEVASRVERAIAHAQLARLHPAVKRIAFLVPQSYDCGDTYHALLYGLVKAGLLGRVQVYSMPGHHSREVLNFGIHILSGEVSHALIISGKAMSYFTLENQQKIDRAFEKGALVAGLAVDELREMVLDGRIQNTFAAWDIDALLGMGLFETSAGVEEIAPLIRLARNHGPCIAPIDVAAGALDVHTSESAQARHVEVMSTKLARQQDECARLGADFSTIRDAAMH